MYQDRTRVNQTIPVREMGFHWNQANNNSRAEEQVHGRDGDEDLFRVCFTARLGWQAGRCNTVALVLDVNADI